MTTEHTPNELKPCPFCGAGAFTVKGYANLWRAKCHDCGNETRVQDTRDEAIAAWNTRSPTPSTEPPPELIERIAKAIADAFDADAPDTTNLARAALTAMPPAEPVTPETIRELNMLLERRRNAEPVGDAELEMPADEQHFGESTSELVDRLLYMLGPDTDFDNYNFMLKRGNLRRILAALQATPSNHVETDHG